VSFQADYKGIGEMLCAPFMVSDMHRRAELVAELARATGPRKTGEYVSRFKVSSGIRQGRTRRAFGRVTNDSDHAIHVEFGTEDTPAHRTLRRALSAAKG
jgi:hypothetical protein